MEYRAWHNLFSVSSLTNCWKLLSPSCNLFAWCKINLGLAWLAMSTSINIVGGVYLNWQPQAPPIPGNQAGQGRSGIERQSSSLFKCQHSPWCSFLPSQLAASHIVPGHRMGDRISPWAFSSGRMDEATLLWGREEKGAQFHGHKDLLSSGLRNSYCPVWFANVGMRYKERDWFARPLSWVLQIRLKYP